MRPKPKVQAGGAAGAASVVLVWALGAVGADVPPEVASALTVLVSFGASWVKTDAAPRPAVCESGGSHLRQH